MDPLIRAFLIGPAVAAMYGFYALAITRTGALRIIIGVPFMAMNALCNATCGSFMVWELPREWFFTDRLKRHKTGEDPERARVAEVLCREMNKADPGHC